MQLFMQSRTPKLHNIWRLELLPVMKSPVGIRYTCAIFLTRTLFSFSVSIVRLARKGRTYLLGSYSLFFKSYYRNGFALLIACEIS